MGLSEGMGLAMALLRGGSWQDERVMCKQYTSDPGTTEQPWSACPTREAGNSSVASFGSGLVGGGSQSVPIRHFLCNFTSWSVIGYPDESLKPGCRFGLFCYDERLKNNNVSRIPAAYPVLQASVLQVGGPWCCEGLRLGNVVTLLAKGIMARFRLGTMSMRDVLAKFYGSFSATSLTTGRLSQPARSPPVV